MYFVVKTNLESENIIKEVQDDYLNYFLANETNIYFQHTKEWSFLWESGLEIDNDYLAQRINSSIYSLYSNIREEWVYGISPGGFFLF
jgi:hypothetical protein